MKPRHCSFSLPAKGVTLVNYCVDDLADYVVDKSPRKPNHFMSAKRVFETKPD
jgi:hypothetical protein